MVFPACSFGSDLPLAFSLLLLYYFCTLFLLSLLFFEAILILSFSSV